MKLQAKRYDAAVRLQNATRVRAARKKVKATRVQRKQDRAAQRIQARYRGKLGREKAKERAVVVAAERKKLTLMAQRVQRIYRGHRGRIAYLVRLQAWKAKRAVDDAAALKVQKLSGGAREENWPPRGKRCILTIWYIKRGCGQRCLMKIPKLGTFITRRLKRLRMSLPFKDTQSETASLFSKMAISWKIPTCLRKRRQKKLWRSVLSARKGCNAQMQGVRGSLLR